MAEERTLKINIEPDFSKVEQGFENLEQRAAQGVRVGASGTTGSGGGRGRANIIDDTGLPSRGSRGNGNHLDDRYEVRYENRLSRDRTSASDAIDRAYERSRRDSASAAEREAKATQKAADAAERRARQIENLQENRADSIAYRNLQTQNANEARFGRSQDAAQFAEFRAQNANATRFSANQTAAQYAAFRAAENDVAQFESNVAKSGAQTSSLNNLFYGPASQGGLSGGGGTGGGLGRSGLSSLVIRRIALGSIVGLLGEGLTTYNRRLGDEADAPFQSQNERLAAVLGEARSQRNSIGGLINSGLSSLEGWLNSSLGNSNFTRNSGLYAWNTTFNPTGSTERLEGEQQLQTRQERNFQNQSLAERQNLQNQALSQYGNSYAQALTNADLRRAEAFETARKQYVIDVNNNDPRTLEYQRGAEGRANTARDLEKERTRVLYTASLREIRDAGQAAFMQGELDPTAGLFELARKDRAAELAEKDPDKNAALVETNRQREAAAQGALVRDSRNQLVSAQAQLQSNQQLLQGNTFNSQLALLEGQRKVALSGLPGNITGPGSSILNPIFSALRSAINQNFDTQESLASRNDDIQRYSTWKSLENQKNITGFEANRRQYTAQAQSIVKGSELQANLFRAQGGPDAEVNAKNTTQIGINQLTTFQNQLEFQKYYGARSADGYAGGGLGAGAGNNNADRYGETVTDGLKAVATAIDELKRFLSGP